MTDPFPDTPDGIYRCCYCRTVGQFTAGQCTKCGHPFGVCHRCGNQEDRLHGFCSDYCRDMYEVEQERDRLQKALVLEDSALVEKLASYAHFAWSQWMHYQFEHSIRNDDGSITIPAAFIERWSRQAETDYLDLPEVERQSDQVEAEAILVTLRKALYEIVGKESR